MLLIEKIIRASQKSESYSEAEKKRIERFIKRISEDDEVAKRTEWGSLLGVGVNYNFTKLRKVNDYKITISLTNGSYALILSIIAGLSGFYGGYFISYFGVLFLISAIVIETIIVYIILKSITSKHFDKNMGKFYSRGYFSKKFEIELKEIHAIQLIRVGISSDDYYYYICELNIIFKDGQRHNIMDHGNLSKITQYSQTLSDFLEVPLWNASKLYRKRHPSDYFEILMRRFLRKISRKFSKKL